MGKSKKHDTKSKSKHKRKEKKKKSKKSLKEKKKSKEVERKQEKVPVETAILKEDKSVDDFAIPLELMNSKSHAPETPEEYKERQNRIRRETDPVTGRSRLIKGDSEVIEEIVSKERHKAINRMATKGDGEFFQGNTVGKR